MLAYERTDLSDQDQAIFCGILNEVYSLFKTAGWR
jgi:hypothetical protein